MKVYFQIAERSISYAKIKHSDYKHHEKRFIRHFE